MGGLGGFPPNFLCFTYYLFCKMLAGSLKFTIFPRRYVNPSHDKSNGVYNCGKRDESSLLTWAQPYAAFRSECVGIAKLQSPGKQTSRALTAEKAGRLFGVDV